VGSLEVISNTYHRLIVGWHRGGGAYVLGKTPQITCSPDGTLDIPEDRCDEGTRSKYVGQKAETSVLCPHHLRKGPVTHM